MANKETIPTTTSKGSASVPERLKALDRTQKFAVLATEEAGIPYTSLIAFALSPDLTQVLFATPKSTRKYRNIVSGKHVALLVDSRSQAGKDLLGAEAVTIAGIAAPLKRGHSRDALAAVFLRKHPELDEFVRSSTTALISVSIRECVHVSRFQAVSVWRPSASSEKK
jgi:nitroimidazol reductase NimA-like FMN-containing flavoprotein (pyridoxamine 5'-phosphate oxidase superfamily)